MSKNLIVLLITFCAIFITTARAEAEPAQGIIKIEGAVWAYIGDGGQTTAERILTCVFIQSEKTKEKIIAFTPINYGAQGSFLKFRKLMASIKNKTITIHGYLITQQNLNKTKCTRSEYEMYVHEGFKIIIMDKITAGTTELIFK